jgi:hypothetical protein
VFAAKEKTTGLTVLNTDLIHTTLVRLTLKLAIIIFGVNLDNSRILEAFNINRNCPSPMF